MLFGQDGKLIRGANLTQFSVFIMLYTALVLIVKKPASIDRLTFLSKRLTSTLGFVSCPPDFFGERESCRQVYRQDFDRQSLSDRR